MASAQDREEVAGAGLVVGVNTERHTCSQCGGTWQPGERDKQGAWWCLDCIDVLCRSLLQGLSEMP